MPSKDEAKIADWFSGGWLLGFSAGDDDEVVDEATYLDQGQKDSENLGDRRYEQASGGSVGSIQPASPSQRQNYSQDSNQQFQQMLGGLTEKDQEGPTSFSVTPDKEGGYTYKMDGKIGGSQQQTKSKVSQSSQIGTEDDFMKAYGG